MLTENPMTALERRVVGALALLYSFRMLGLFMVLPLLALYTADMAGATPVIIGIALGAYGFTQALLQIPLGWLSDRIGRKPVILGGLALFAIGSVVAACADNIGLIVLGRALQGAGAISSSVMALAADVTAPEQRTKAMAVIGISIGASFTVALVCGPAIAAWGGLEAVFWITAFLAVLGMMIVVLGIPAATPQDHAEVGTSRERLPAVLQDRALQRLNGSIFTLHFILTATFLVLPGLIEESLRIGREQHWAVYLPVLAASLLTMYPLLRLSERAGRPALALRSAVALLPVSLAMLLISAQASVLYLALCGFFAAINYLEAAFPSLVSKVVDAGGKGTALGVYATCQFLGAFAGGTVGGLFLAAGGTLGVIGLLLLLSLAWLFLIWRMQTREAVSDAHLGLS